MYRLIMFLNCHLFKTMKENIVRKPANAEERTSAEEPTTDGEERFSSGDRESADVA